MYESSYPSALSEIDSWSKSQRVTTLEARVRFMGFVILNCFASNPVTRTGLVLKGGNALRFAYLSPRSTKYLDFPALVDEVPDQADKIRETLDRALLFAERRFNVKAKCQRVKRNPKSPEATRPTYDVTIGYQFPTDRYFHNFEDRTFPTVIPIEITLNDLVCETTEWKDILGLRVCSLEDIVAEKLRSLLQQKPRNRNRWQDAYDICRVMRQTALDLDKVTEYFVSKSSIRDIEARKSSFDLEIRQRAELDYETRMRIQAPHDTIPFEDAWRSVKYLVNSLDIPN